MDDQQFPMWLVWCALAGFMFYWFGIRPYHVLRDLGIPGSTPLPFIGTAYKMFGSMDKLHIRFLEAKRKWGNVYGGYFGTQPFIMMADLDMVKEVFVKQFSNFTDRFSIDNPRPFDQMLFVSRGEKWSNVRHKLTPAFSAAKLKQTIPLIHDCCNTLVEKMDQAASSGEPVNIHNWLQGFTMEVITSVAFGVRSESQTNTSDSLTQMARRVFDQKPLFQLTVLLPWPLSSWIQRYVFSEPMHGLCKLSEVARQIIKQRKITKNFERKDLLQLMLDSQEELKENPMTDDEIVAQACTFLIAGYETSSTSLGFLCHHLAVDDHVQDELLREIDSVWCSEQDELPSYETLNNLPYMDMVISEVLRMYPPAFVLSRLCTANTNIMGYALKKGIVLMCSTYALHMDPNVWPEPDKFDPMRFSTEEKAKRNSYSYAPFGYGPRNCIGMRLALLEMKVCLLRMLKYHRLEVCPQTKIPMEPVARQVLGIPGGGVVVRIARRN